MLHEQQLGWDWQAPHETVFSPGLPSQSAASMASNGEEGEEGETEEEAAARRGEAEVQERIRN